MLPLSLSSYHPLFDPYTWMTVPESQMVAVTVRAGKAEMALPDGTFVHLNAATNLNMM